MKRADTMEVSKVRVGLAGWLMHQPHLAQPLDGPGVESSCAVFDILPLSVVQHWVEFGTSGWRRRRIQERCGRDHEDRSALILLRMDLL